MQVTSRPTEGDMSDYGLIDGKYVRKCLHDQLKHLYVSRYSTGEVEKGAGQYALLVKMVSNFMDSHSD